MKATRITKTCPTCVIPISGRQAYCSIECRPACTVYGCETKATRQSNTLCGLHDARNREGRPMWRTCEICGRSTEGRPAKSRRCERHDQCDVAGCSQPIKVNGMCVRHNSTVRRNGSPHQACATCGQAVERGPGNWTYCSENCRPKCRASGCENPARGADDVCGTHQMQLRRSGEIKPLRWASEWVCVVCGAEVEKGSGRRKHCSSNCQMLDHRWKGKRPKTFTCRLCGEEKSLLAMSGSKRQRSDTKWCKDCGRDSPKVKRFMIYGVTPEQYERAVERGCEICGRRDIQLHVDHDHNCCVQRGGSSAICGKCVRGFLCGSCNRAIGLMQDDPDVLTRAIEYLKK